MMVCIGDFMVFDFVEFFFVDEVFLKVSDDCVLCSFELSGG